MDFEPRFLRCGPRRLTIPYFDTSLRYRAPAGEAKFFGSSFPSDGGRGKRVLVKIIGE